MIRVYEAVTGSQYTGQIIELRKNENEREAGDSVPA